MPVTRKGPSSTPGPVLERGDCSLSNSDEEKLGVLYIRVTVHVRSYKTTINKINIILTIFLESLNQRKKRKEKRRKIDYEMVNKQGTL
jgi:hypothetical protein